MHTELNRLLAILQKDYDNHLHVMKRYLTADNSNMFVVDLLANAAVNRSMSNIKGFSESIRNDNYLLSSSIIRLQLDTLLRFYALHLVDAPEELARSILSGKKLDRIKDKNGELLNGANLCKKFGDEEKLLWVKDVYDRTSGFIHLSLSHIAATMKISEDNSERIAHVAVTGGAEYVLEEHKIESAQCMIHITQLLLKYIIGWALTKESFPTKR